MVLYNGNYTVSGSTVTFDFTPSGSSVCNGIRHYGVGLLTTVSDSSITTAKLGADAVTTAKINDGAVTSGKIASGVIPTSRPNVSPLIINGDMAVAQRSTNATGLGGGSGYKSLDRYYSTFFYSSSNVGTFTQSQSTDVPTGYGFRNSFKTDCTTAQTSLPASGQINVRYTVEAQDLNPFKFGTANAEKMTLAFWVKSNLTGTYNVSLYNQDGGSTPQVNSQYSISSANTWEKKVLVFPADTTNGFADDNGPGLSIDWIMGTGSTYTGGTAPTTWSSFVNNTYNGGSTVNMASSTSNEWLITGIQLEVGEYTSSTIPPFQHESFGDNLARCQRYFQMRAEGNQKIISIAHWGSSNEVDFIMQIPFMRTRPSVEYTTGNEYWAIGGGGSTNTLDNLNMNSWSTEMNINLWTTTGAGGTTGFAYYGYSNNASAKLGFTAEL